MAGTAPSSSMQLGSEETSSPLPRFSLFSSEFWATPTNGATAIGHESDSEGSDFTTEDALQSLKLIRNRFNGMKLNTINEANTVSLADTVLSEADIISAASKNVISKEDKIDESTCELEADFVFVSIPTSAEIAKTPSPKRRNSILQSLDLSSRISRRLSISLSSTITKLKSPTRSPHAGANVASKDKKLMYMPDRKSFNGKGSPTPARTATPIQSATMRRATVANKKLLAESCSAAPVNTRSEQGASSPTAARPSFRSQISSLKTNNASTSYPTNLTNSNGTRTVPTSILRISDTTGTTICNRSVRAINRATTPALSRYTVSPSATKMKSTVHSFTPANHTPTLCLSATPPLKKYRSRIPVQHHRPPPPIPTARGKENLGSAKGKVRSASNVVGVKNMIKTVK
ncbi:hypothetical protein J3R30DRAFT_1842919 [Lentinula aciculospora]|uniref:Uncharacterized protein n=1 Tax=Lentinula aciculospora TaxID=153920 RepID=A0A9W9DS34_9AGAR|nr:hypothetical protein J3R30DRAFT_1842919 [Lentinula aciculospora]